MLRLKLSRKLQFRMPPLRRIAVAAALLMVLLGAARLALTLRPKPLLVNRGGSSQLASARFGEVLKLSLSSDEKYRLWTPLSEISPELVNATLLYEDRHFFRHPGINPFSLVRAFVSTYVTGGTRTGGSTITMQLARLRFATDTRTIRGKLRQILTALELELRFSKTEILEAYLNLAPYGGNVEGAGAAARIYFGKRARDLSALEALTLAVIPQNPTKRTPTAPSNAALLDARMRLYRSFRDRYPENAPNQSEIALPFRSARRGELPTYAPHFVQQVFSAYPDTPELKTTLDFELQRLTEENVRSYLAAHREEGIRNAAVMLINWQTMEVEALAGSADFFDAAIQGQVDGTLARRSPGSALKPFLYGLALDQGLIHPLTMLKDVPLSLASYDPENYDRTFIGPVNATDALVRSRNVPAVELANRLAAGSFHALLRRAGVRRLREEAFYGLALTLGGVEVTLQELVRLYASLPNGGRTGQLRFVQSGADSRTPGVELLSPEAAFIVLGMLADNPRPDEALSERELGRPKLSWKTGTSFGFRDAWAVGVFGEYVLGVWIGNFDGRANPIFIGRETAGRVFFSIADAIRIQRGLSLQGPGRAPLSIRNVEVCPLSGQLPGPDCPHRTKTLFIPGKSPILTCTVHRKISIDDATGLRACAAEGGMVHDELFEFWSSDLLAVFKRAGIPRRVPPPFKPECSDSEQTGLPPTITSPERGLTYHVRLAHLEEDRQALTTDEPIAFRAATDADAKKLFWFVDSRLVGTTAPGEPLLWKPLPGTFIVRVVDTYGRADARELKVQVSE